MTARHAGVSRLADQALTDQVRACAEEMKPYLYSAQPIDTMWLAKWAGRALALLEQIGEMAE